MEALLRRLRSRFLTCCSRLHLHYRFSFQCVSSSTQAISVPSTHSGRMNRLLKMLFQTLYVLDLSALPISHRGLIDNILPCCVIKSPSLIVKGCSSSPTGALILTLNFCSTVHRLKVAGCVVSLKLIAISTVVLAPGPNTAGR